MTWGSVGEVVGVNKPLYKSRGKVAQHIPFPSTPWGLYLGWPFFSQ